MKKSFNLEQFRNGAKAQTSLGCPAKFVCISNRGELIVEITSRASYTKDTYKYQLDGRKYKNTSTIYDLEMV